MMTQFTFVRTTAAFISCLVLMPILTSCTNSRKIGPIQETDFSESIRIACIGDSITFGFGIPDREQNSYPTQLQKLLGKRWEVKNFGVNGATALKQGTKPYSVVPEFKEALSFKPNVVIIKLGTNDTNAKSWPDHKSEFLSDYLELVRSFQTLDSKPRIYLCLPVPLFRDRGKEYDTDKILTEEVIPKIKEVAETKNLPVIDLYAALEDKSALLPDGVHPNGEGARIMASSLYTALTGRLATTQK